MYMHAPPGYICPFCLLIQGKENEQTQLKQTDIVFQTADITVFMATRKWPNNGGHVLIIPNEHFENIYELPLHLSSEIHALSRNIALAMESCFANITNLLGIKIFFITISTLFHVMKTIIFITHKKVHLPLRSVPNMLSS